MNMFNLTLLMKKKILFVSIALFFCKISFTQTYPKRELRGSWIATYANIDWPATGASSAQEQSTYIQRMGELKAIGMNAVFVQIRSQCDAMYASSFEPWSKDLTGTQGLAPNPYYDPLSFMITETRKKGMEFHAWMNPYRALATATTSSLAALHSSHIINTQPSWILDCTTISNGSVQKILNPGLPQVWDYVVGVVMDVVRRYDVDGIHFDDYFYPSPSLTTYNDDATYATYGRGISTKSEWRRSNVDTLIRRLNDSIHAVKPWVKFGISPSGIWLSYASSPSINTVGSNTSSGATQHYKDLFCNSRLWQQQGWVDYLMPQVYWYMGQTGSDYSNLIPWWHNNAFTRHMYIGMAGYKVGDIDYGNFYNNNREIPNQVRLNRQYLNIKGQVIYNLTSLRNNALGFKDSLATFYTKPALLPTMSWLDNAVPASPSLLTVSQTAMGYVDLSWTNPTTSTSEMDKVKRIAVYRFTSPTVDITNANNLLAITWNDTTGYRDNTVQPGVLYYYVVTSLDRLYNESLVSNTASLVALPLQVITFNAKRNEENKLLLNWQTENENNISFFEVERSYNNLNFITQKKQNALNGTKNNYEVLDDISGLNNQLYYRLKIVEKDSKYYYSNTVKIFINRKLGILVYPTLVQKGSNISISKPQIDVVQLFYSLVDVNGRIMQQGNLSISNTSTIQLNNTLSNGLYYLVIKSLKGIEEKFPITIQ